MSTVLEEERVLYTARVHTSGGRDGGKSQSDDDRLHVALSAPGSRKAGTNPEQLFAAGWSACFEGAMQIAAKRSSISLPPDTAIDAEVDLRMAGASYFLQVRLNVDLPGLPRDLATALIEAAHRTCPYSKASRGNIDLFITLSGPARPIAIIAETVPRERKR